VLKVNQENERLMEEYERLASDVSKYIMHYLLLHVISDFKYCLFNKI